MPLDNDSITEMINFFGTKLEVLDVATLKHRGIIFPGTDGNLGSFKQKRLGLEIQQLKSCATTSNHPGDATIFFFLSFLGGETPMC